jgi:hypothetical protein
MWCKHLEKGRTNEEAWMACAAFPSGIPESITSSENGHWVSEPGDSGVVFEPVGEDQWYRAKENPGGL